MKILNYKSVLSLLFLSVMLCLNSCSEIKQQQLVEEANKLNATLPMVTDGIRIDKCVVEPGLTLKYTATILGVKAKDLDFRMLASQSFLDQSKREIVTMLKDSSDFEEIRELGVTIIYSYFDIRGNHLFDVRITSNDYN
ncbi:MAG: hypothetical protein LBN27_13200 [Prevotellaceae bacterium]|jgi:hypothetical protein|nr:hypothetical protein [Prevotellaceae bacterium]